METSAQWSGVFGGDSDLNKDIIACHQDTSYLPGFFEKINTATNRPQGKTPESCKGRLERSL